MQRIRGERSYKRLSSLSFLIMRSNSAHDKQGNNYRYCREQIRQKELKERKAQAKRWDDIYQKAVRLDEK